MKVFQHFSLMFTHQVRIDRVCDSKRSFSAVVRYRIAISVGLRAVGSCKVLLWVKPATATPPSEHLEYYIIWYWHWYYIIIYDNLCFIHCYTCSFSNLILCCSPCSFTPHLHNCFTSSWAWQPSTPMIFFTWSRESLPSKMGLARVWKKSDSCGWCTVDLLYNMMQYNSTQYNAI